MQEPTSLLPGSSRNSQRNPLKSIIDFLNVVPIVVGSLLLAWIALVVCANVFTRFFLSSSLVWSDELARFSLIWATFLGAAVVVRYNDHITVDVFMAGAPRQLRWLTALLRHLVTIGLSLLLIYFGIEQVGMQSVQLSTALQLNMGAVYLVLPISGLYMLVYSLINLAAHVMGIQLQVHQQEKVEL